METEKKSRRPVVTILLCNLFLALTVGFFSPLEVLLANAKEFFFPFGNIWWFQLLVSLAAAGILTLLMCLLPGRAGIIAAGVSFALGLAAYIQMLFLNGDMVALTGDEMTVTTEGKTLNLVIWGVLLLAVLAMVFLFSRRHRRGTEIVLRAVAAALVVMQAVGFVSSAATAKLTPARQEQALSTEKEFVFGKEKNVIVLLLDTADGMYGREMVERWPELSEILSGWTYYPNAVSRYSKTYPALPYLLSGIPCWLDKPVDDYLTEAYGTGAFLKGLKAAGVDTRVLTMDPMLVTEAADPYLDNSVGYQYSSFGNLNLPELEKNLMSISLYKCLPYQFKEDFSYTIQDINSSSFNTSYDDYMYFSYQDDDFHYDLDEAVTATDQYPKAFRLYHLLGVHKGVRWDENLEEIEEESDMEDFPAALRGCFRNVESLIDQLKAQGLYDNTTIIVSADHGLNRHFNDEESLFLKEPASLLLMVKYAGSDTTKPMQVSQDPVCQEDFFATVENALEIPVSGCGSGKTFADFSADPDRERYYYHTVVRQSVLGDLGLREYRVQGDAGDFAAWEPTGKTWTAKYSFNRVNSGEPFPEDAEEEKK